MGKWIGVVGESFANEDGSSRQDEIARCSVGEPVALRLDPDNRFDPNCVRVISMRGIQIGNLSKEHAALLAARLRQGNEVDGDIAKINGGSPGKPSLGVVIELDVDEEDFEKSLQFVRDNGLAGQRFHRPAPSAGAVSGILAELSKPPGLWLVVGAAVLLLAKCAT